MSKLILLLAVCCLCLCLTQVHAQARAFCDGLVAECRRHEREVGPRDDTVDIYNQHCARIDRTWRRITRCQLVHASCLLTMVRCDNLTCKNVAGVL
ncbi:uncharacterized protein LOC108150883 [Drosophila miranda]|uniref:uncharacterized protein LOC108150883 n=1 Tax=Drosophila miranda TaxID=7229 RepID=UPI0007E6D6D8|nr:uncharacterized protein LOC108150883 [Drosophila miranda]